LSKPYLPINTPSTLLFDGAGAGFDSSLLQAMNDVVSNAMIAKFKSFICLLFCLFVDDFVYFLVRKCKMIPFRYKPVQSAVVVDSQLPTAG
jgi:hypothetical protein